MKRVEERWGSVISVDVRDDLAELALEHALDDVFQWFTRVDDVFSTWRDDSEIARVSDGRLSLAAASNDLRTVLVRCEELRIETCGAFDVTFGARALAAPRPGLAAIDPSGFVKGWAVDRAGARLQTAGFANFCINAAGDVLVKGTPRRGSRWKIGIQHPFSREDLAMVVAVTDVGVATSGRYERGEHIFEPTTGLPAHGLASVTVIGADLGRADALATATVARGPAGMDWVAGVADVDAMGITDDGEVLLTPGFARHRLEDAQ